MSWLQWCGLCAKIPEPETANFPVLQSVDGIQDFLVKWFPVEPRDQCPVCLVCLENIRSVQEYFENILTVQEMFISLRRKRGASAKAIKSIRDTYLRKTESSPAQLTQIKVTAGSEREEVLPEPEADEQIEMEDSELDLKSEVEDEDVEELELSVERGESHDEDEEVVVEFGNLQPNSQATEKDGISQEDSEEEPSPTIKRQKRQGSRQTATGGKSSKQTTKCRYCDRRFRLENYLRAHERMHENTIPGQLPYPCEHCDKRYPTLSRLMTHSLVHSNATPYSCDQCDKSFKNVTRLKVHQETHQEGKIVCPICGLGLNSMHSYNKHKYTHSTVRRYKCPVCPKDFRKQTALKEHLISHVGLRPYSCPFCDKSFINGSSVRLHKVRSHPEELKELESSGKSEEVLAKHRNLPTLEELKVQAIAMFNKGTDYDEHIAV